MIKSLCCGLCLGVSVCLLGCGKAGTDPAPVVLNGKSINITSFREAFGSAKPDLVKTADKVLLSITYGDCPSAVKELSTLAGDSALTVDQKEAVRELDRQ